MIWIDMDSIEVVLAIHTHYILHFILYKLHTNKSSLKLVDFWSKILTFGFENVTIFISFDFDPSHLCIIIETVLERLALKSVAKINVHFISDENFSFYTFSLFVWKKCFTRLHGA